SPYTSSSAFAGWGGLLADRGAAVGKDEIEAFRARHSDWAEDWERFAGASAVADQVRFEREWSALRAYAAERDVRLIGDVPIYVAADSCDHAAHPELFLPDGYVAGAPPDPLNEEGQKWGNPLYDWDALSRENYRWWTERLRRMLDLFDAFRIYHFRS